MVLNWFCLQAAMLSHQGHLARQIALQEGGRADIPALVLPVSRQRSHGEMEGRDRLQQPPVHSPGFGNNHEPAPSLRASASSDSAGPEPVSSSQPQVRQMGTVLAGRPLLSGHVISEPHQALPPETLARRYSLVMALRQHNMLKPAQVSSVGQAGSFANLLAAHYAQLRQQQQQQQQEPLHQSPQLSSHLALQPLEAGAPHSNSPRVGMLPASGE